MRSFQIFDVTTGPEIFVTPSKEIVEALWGLWKEAQMRKGSRTGERTGVFIQEE
jgi:hypothetical protein